MRVRRVPKPIPLAPIHRSVWRRWCVCGLKWRRCPDRHASVPTTADEKLPPYWATATTDEYDELARARVWRRNGGTLVNLPQLRAHAPLRPLWLCRTCEGPWPLD
jgi:hypothetical protein